MQFLDSVDSSTQIKSSREIEIAIWSKMQNTVFHCNTPIFYARIACLPKTEKQHILCLNKLEVQRVIKPLYMLF